MKKDEAFEDSDMVRNFMLANLQGANHFANSHVLQQRRMEPITFYEMGNATPFHIEPGPTGFHGPALAQCVTCERTEVDGVTMRLVRNHDGSVVNVELICPCGRKELVRVMPEQSPAPFLAADKQWDNELVACVCGRELPALQMMMVSHTDKIREVVTLLDRCPACASKPRCDATSDGVHRKTERPAYMPAPDEIDTCHCECGDDIYLCHDFGWQTLTWAKVAQAWELTKHVTGKIRSLEREALLGVPQEPDCNLSSHDFWCYTHQGYHF